MPEYPPLTPAQMAHNDQILAGIQESLDALIDMHHAVSEGNGEIHEQARLAGFASYLKQHSDLEWLGLLLAVAVDRLAKSDGPRGDSR